MTYSETNDYFVVSSFYWRVYELMNLTDFEGYNSPYLDEGDFQLQTLALLEICARRSYKIEINEFYKF